MIPWCPLRSALMSVTRMSLPLKLNLGKLKGNASRLWCERCLLNSCVFLALTEKTWSAQPSFTGNDKISLLVVKMFFVLPLILSYIRVLRDMGAEGNFMSWLNWGLLVLNTNTVFLFFLLIAAFLICIILNRLVSNNLHVDSHHFP